MGFLRLVNVQGRCLTDSFKMQIWTKPKYSYHVKMKSLCDKSPPEKSADMSIQEAVFLVAQNSFSP